MNTCPEFKITLNIKPSSFGRYMFYCVEQIPSTHKTHARASKHVHSFVPKIYFSITFALTYQNVVFTFILKSCTYFPLYSFPICVHSLFYLLVWL